MRLRQRADYLAIQSGGKKLHGRHLLAIARRQPSFELAGRLGITVTKKIGNAVVRNRIRRFVREWVRLHGWVPSGWDVVLVAKDTAASQVSRDAFAPDLSRVLRELAA